MNEEKSNEFDRIMDDLTGYFNQMKVAKNSPLHNTPNKENIKKYHYTPISSKQAKQAKIVCSPFKNPVPELEARISNLTEENFILKKMLENERIEKQKLVVELNQLILHEKKDDDGIDPNLLIIDEKCKENKLEIENYREEFEKIINENKQLKLDVESLKCIVKKRTEQANGVIKKLTQTISENNTPKNLQNNQEFMETKANLIKLQVDFKIQSESLEEIKEENIRLKCENEKMLEHMKKLRSNLFSVCSK